MGFLRSFGVRFFGGKRVFSLGFGGFGGISVEDDLLAVGRLVGVFLLFLLVASGSLVFLRSTALGTAAQSYPGPTALVR